MVDSYDPRRALQRKNTLVVSNSGGHGRAVVLEHHAGQLACAGRPEKIRGAATVPKSSYWAVAGEYYRKNAPRRVISDALDELAHEIASQLLGTGYGTGEYTLYGAVTVDFETGEMNDDPDAEQPTDQM